MRDIGVASDEGPVSLEAIEAFERKMSVRFPASYKALLSAHNNLYPRCSSFDFVNPWGMLDRRGVIFYGFETDDENIEDFQPDGSHEEAPIVAIGEDGGGDQVCFDYRDCPGTDDPPVVFLYHDLWWPDEAGEWHRVIWPIAPSFDAFLEMLYERDYSFLDGGHEDEA
ncbi:MAG TPA: SMI1/KNR4 family protein [Chromatiales bacterium]|nr:SMI1/KNR4 family protein [Chromatiales bacterium]